MEIAEPTNALFPKAATLGSSTWQLQISQITQLGCKKQLLISNATNERYLQIARYVINGMFQLLEFANINVANIHNRE
jgi:hypothetical protein